MTQPELPDDVPVADALDQQREAVPPTDSDDLEPPVDGLPLETPRVDWAEQQIVVPPPSESEEGLDSPR